MADDLKKNGRRPQKKWKWKTTSRKMEDDLKKLKMEDDLKKKKKKKKKKKWNGKRPKKNGRRTNQPKST